MSEEEEVQNIEPVAPPAEPEPTQEENNSQKETPVKTLADMSDDEEVTLTAGDLRRLRVDLYQQFVEEGKRQELMKGITALNLEISQEFLDSLHSNEQLEWFKAVVDKLIARITERDNSIAQLEQVKYRLTGEKPSLSAATDAENSAEAVAKRAYGADPFEKYPVRAKMMGKRLNIPRGDQK
jgi:hypothetical protein